MIGVIRLQQGRAAEALAIFDPLVAQAPGDADIRTQRGLALQDLGRRQEALADFDQAQAIQPGHVVSLLYRGNLFLEAGMRDAALEAYDRLLTASRPTMTRPGFAAAPRCGCWTGSRMRWPVMPRRWRSIRAASAPPSTAARCCSSWIAMTKPWPRLKRRSASRPTHPYVLGGIASAVLGGADLARWEACRDQVDGGGEGQKRGDRAADLPAVLRRRRLAARLQRGFCRRPRSRRPAPLWKGERYDHEPHPHRLSVVGFPPACHRRADRRPDRAP